MAHHALLTDALRSALLLAAALLAMPFLRRAASSTRRLVLALALGAALVLPALSAALPRWQVKTPESFVTTLGGRIIAEPAAQGSASTPAPASSATSAAAVPTPWRTDPFEVVASVWALGALLLIARLATSLVRARAVAHRAVPAAGWERARARAERVTGVRMEVRETTELDAPAVCGVLSPVLLVPPGASGWDEQLRHHVLLHETAHVRRYDCLVQLVADLTVALHWFDPLAWLCARRLRVERELAADDAALEHGARPSSYAEDLLSIAGALPAPAGALGMGEPARLVARVRAVLEQGRRRAPLGVVKTAGVVAAASSAALALACTAPTEAARSAAASASAPSDLAAADSSIDPAIQTIADEELDRSLREWAAPAGVAVVIDPSTGQVLADAGRDRGARADVARLHAYIPGSTMKIVVLAAALEAGVVSPTDTIDGEQGEFRYAGEVIVDGNGPHGVLPLSQAIAVSSNIAIAKVFDRVGGDRLGRELRALHFGAAPGSIPDRIDDHSLEGVETATGEGVTATPLQVAAAYVAIANGGSYVEPAFSAHAGAIHREPVMKPETAHAVLAMLDEVVNTERGTGKLARVEGARVAGKTGTSGWDLPDGTEGVYTSFVGIVPEDAPRFVILVGVEQPQNHGNDVSGGLVAAPAFARIAARALASTRR